MRMLIDNRDLELLLEKKKKFIGNKVTVDTMIAGISFLLSVFTATYSDWFAKFLIRQINFMISR